MTDTCCPTCLRPLGTGRHLQRALRLHRIARIRPVPGQLEIDWTWRWPTRRTPARRPIPRPYDFQPIEDDIRGGDEVIANRLHISWATLKRVRADGLTADQADRFAVLLGTHPAEFWPDYGRRGDDDGDLDDDDDPTLFDDL